MLIYGGTNEEGDAAVRISSGVGGRAIWLMPVIAELQHSVFFVLCILIS